MIALNQIAELDLSAASGLVCEGPLVFVVADDEHFLDAYQIDDGRLRGRVALGLGPKLPEDDHARKRRKPDLEALAALPRGKLLAVGSGSTELRQTALLFGPERTPEGLPTAPPRVSLAPLYERLRTEFPKLNIEGAAVAAGHLKLLQRGNGRRAQNALIELEFTASLRELEEGALSDAPLLAIRPVSLGKLEGVPLGFTDAAPLAYGSPRIAFIAAAEDTDDPYKDGACPGSVIGILDGAGSVEWAERVEGRHKLEGLALMADRSALLVADPDDRSRRAPLLRSVFRF